MSEITNKDSLKASNFWFGFSLGIVSVSLLVYFFGTKNGRKTLKNLLELTENLEENLSGLIKELEKLDNNPPDKISSSINHLIDKVKVFTK